MSRSRAKLAGAVLRLAAERDVPTLTVAEISAEAGVNRSTFYQHAPSPAALLCLVLSAELDVIRERHLAAADGDIRAALEEVTLAVMEHIQEHWGVYRRGLAVSGEAPGLQAMLGNHFEASARLVFESRRVRIRGAPATRSRRPWRPASSPTGWSGRSRSGSWRTIPNRPRRWPRTCAPCSRLVAAPLTPHRPCTTVSLHDFLARRRRGPGPVRRNPARAVVLLPGTRGRGWRPRRQGAAGGRTRGFRPECRR